MSATYKDIQRLTGLSLSTISKYFNGKTVLPGNARAIEEAAGTLNFRMNAFAQSLRTQRSMTVGVLLPELANMFHATVVSEVGRTLMASGYGILVGTYGAGRSTIDDAIEFMLRQMVDGLILVPPAEDSWFDFLEGLTREIPIVLLDRVDQHKLDAVVVDNERAGAEVADLFANHGHTELALIGGPATLSSTRGREKGFLSRLADRGIEVRAERVRRCSLVVEEGRLALRELFRSSSPPTAVFAANSELMLGSVIALNELGMRAPDHLSFIGFDDLNLARAVPPGLDVVIQPVEQIAEAAAAMILRRVESGGAQLGELVVLDCELVRGQSVTRPA